MGRDIRTGKVCAFRAVNVGNNNTRLAGASKKRHGIGDRSRGCPAAIPAHHDMIEFEAVFLNKRNDEDRSSGFEQRRLNDDILGRMIPAGRVMAKSKSSRRQGQKGRRRAASVVASAIESAMSELQ